MMHVNAVGPKGTGAIATLEDEKDAKLDKRWKVGGKPTLRGSCGLYIPLSDRNIIGTPWAHPRSSRLVGAPRIPVTHEF